MTFKVPGSGLVNGVQNLVSFHGFITACLNTRCQPRIYGARGHHLTKASDVAPEVGFFLFMTAVALFINERFMLDEMT